VRIPWLLAVLAGCSFQLQAAGDAGGGADADPDATSDGTMTIDADDGIGDVAHVPAAIEDGFDATGHLAIADATINTRSGTIAPTIDVTLPSGTSLTYSAQDAGGRELAILMVGSLQVSGTLRVRGTRAFVIVAESDMVISGVIDGNADGAIEGPGGYSTGPGAGGVGDGDAGSYDDSGGGGGGFGGPGAAGQKSGPTVPGTAGPVYGTPELLRLEGGSGGGGLVPACMGHPPGGGGGAIQLYARGTITLGGVVMVNGGGGSGGLVCPANGLGTSGAGGGSGGAIYVQAALITGAGRLLAHGGGGGGASNFNAGAPGGDGQPGQPAIQAAAGGIGAGTGIGGEVNHGGAGGYRGAGAPALTTLSGANYGNGGGGGGGVGRIVIRAPSIVGIQTSPQAVENP
jgi:hypothetical protein